MMMKGIGAAVFGLAMIQACGSSNGSKGLSIGAGLWKVATCEASDDLWEESDWNPTQKVDLSLQTDESGRATHLVGKVVTDGHMVGEEYIHSWSQEFNAPLTSVTRNVEGGIQYLFDFTSTAVVSTTTEGFTEDNELKHVAIVIGEDEGSAPELQGQKKVLIDYAINSFGTRYDVTTESIDKDCQFSNLSVLSQQ